MLEAHDESLQTAYQRKKIPHFGPKAAGLDQFAIAKIIGRHISTISRELTRNHGGRGYRLKQADNLAVYRRRDKMTLRIVAVFWSRVELFLPDYVETRANQPLAAL